MSFRETCKFMFALFCAINTVFIVTLAIINRNNQGTYILLNEYFFVQTLVFSLSASLPTFILMHSDTALRFETILRKVIHFILLNGIIWGLFYYFNWNKIIAPFAILSIFLVVYAIAQTVLYMQSKELADRLNIRINEIHDKKNATHPS